MTREERGAHPPGHTRVRAPLGHKSNTLLSRMSEARMLLAACIPDALHPQAVLIIPFPIRAPLCPGSTSPTAGSHNITPRGSECALVDDAIRAPLYPGSTSPTAGSHNITPGGSECALVDDAC